MSFTENTSSQFLHIFHCSWTAVHAQQYIFELIFFFFLFFAAHLSFSVKQSVLKVQNWRMSVRVTHYKMNIYAHIYSLFHFVPFFAFPSVFFLAEPLQPSDKFVTIYATHPRQV